MRRSLASLAAVAALAGCGGDKSTAPPVMASSVSISSDDLSLAIGSTVTLAATARDAAGTVLAGRSIAWTTSRPDVATVNAATGLVTALSPGFAVIRATIDQKSDQVLVTVPVPVASVHLAARRTVLGIRGSLQLSATPRDATGSPLVGRSVAWASSDESKARVSPNGLVSGAGAGNVTITATSEGVAGTIALVVVDLPPPQISAVAPATLTPGVTATIAGVNFDTNPVDIDVTVAGVPAAVTEATADRLTIQVPGFLPCQPTQDTPVSVTVIGGTAMRAHPLQVARQRSIAVGEMLVLGGADVRCNELPATPARYALAAMNTSRSPNNAFGVEIRGLAAAAQVSASLSPVASVVGPTPLTWAGAAGRSAGRVSPMRRAARALRAREHAAWLERERALVRRFGRPSRVAARGAQRERPALGVAAAAVAGQLAAAPVPLEVGATTELKILAPNSSNCAQSRPVPARVVYVGTRSVILESTDAPLAKTMDADYVSLGTEYDNTMHGVLTQYFGNPLAYDAKTDSNGRIVMLFTKAVNDRSSGLLGFVTVCDFFPASDPRFAASNQAEIFYARVPTSNENDFENVETRVGWMHLMRGTVVHEAKHLVSYAERFETPEEAQLEESWLEEATAQAAIELWGRATHYAGKATWKGNATYANTMRCDVRPADPACGGQPFVIADHFVFLFSYYEDVESKSYFNSTRADVDVYGSGWLFTRWAADQHASDEAAFFQALTWSWTQTGLANIEARTGRDFASLHADFMMSLYADDLAGLAPPTGARYTIPSWNTRDMFLGMSQDFTRNDQPIPAFPLRLHAAQFGAFSADVSVLSGGAAAYVEISGTPTGPQIVGLRGTGGLALPAETPLRLAILRVQ